MKQLVVMLSTLALALSAAGCGQEEKAVSAGQAPTVGQDSSGSSGSGSGSSSGSATDVETVPEESQPATTGSDATAPKRLLQVWFTEGESLILTWRESDEPEAVGRAAVEALLAGPSGLEAGAGVDSQIPDGTRLLGLSIADGVATVDLSSEFESGGGSASMLARLAQVVYTLTQFDTVKGVRFHLDGRPVSVFSGEGIVLDHPVGRKDYADQLPVILVEFPPLFGQRVSSPLQVSGSANVFEANVTVRILDSAGKEIAKTFTTATCGTGCRGDFSVELPFEVSSEQNGTVVLQDDDAAGMGHPPHEVRFPVTLMPG